MGLGATDGLHARKTHISAVFYEIVHGCQLACVGCPISGLQPKVERAAPALIDRIFRNIDVDRVDALYLFGYGEPLLHDDLPGIFDVVGRQTWSPKKVEISTNAQQVDWQQLEEIVRSRRLTDLVVSCDGDGSPEMYEELRPPSRWSRLIEFLNRARQLRDRFAPDMRLSTRTAVPDWSFRAGWIDLLRPLGWEPQFQHYMYLPDSARNMTGRALDIPHGSCLYVEHYDALFINMDGTVVPCCAHPRAGVFGNLRDQTYSEVLAGRLRAEFVQELRTNRSSMPICGRCEFDDTFENVGTRIAFHAQSAAEAGLVPAHRLTVGRRPR
jgi:MoaA/NifB/PqqE/SkfB family radical SAM enzyme